MSLYDSSKRGIPIEVNLNGKLMKVRIEFELIDLIDVSVPKTRPVRFLGHTLQAL